MFVLVVRITDYADFTERFLLKVNTLEVSNVFCLSKTTILYKTPLLREISEIRVIRGSDK